MVDKKTVDKCKIASLRVRQHLITMTYNAGQYGAHIGGSLSMVELLVGLYLGGIRFRSDDPSWDERDRVILSKGHAAMALYATMAEAGIIDEFELASYKHDGSRLGGHPSLNGTPGIEFASGSLGQGLSLGVGTCLALKMKKNLASRVFVFMGDGECNEGAVWEAFLCAAHYKLDNLVVIIDINNLQYDGQTADIMGMEPLEEKFKAFGCDTICINGNDVEEVLSAYLNRGKKPVAILARTIKGKGVSFMEGDWRYHNASLTKEQYDEATRELQQAYDRIQ